MPVIQFTTSKFCSTIHIYGYKPWTKITPGCSYDLEIHDGIINMEGCAFSKFFIMSTEFDKNISDLSYSCTDHKDGIDFFMRVVKWPKIAVKKCQNLIFKVNFQLQKS